jgi:uncharacterized protein YggL (DUF469 family)
MGKKKFYETDEFKALNAKWQGRAKKSGFDDIDPGDTSVINSQIISTQKTQYDGGNSYYEFCQIILREFRFQKEIHRTIFTLHAEGKSEREIQSWIKKNTMVNFSKTGIHDLIIRVKESFLKGAG